LEAGSFAGDTFVTFVVLSTELALVINAQTPGKQSLPRLDTFFRATGPPCFVLRG
jgi:hypothetical protein